MKYLMILAIGPVQDFIQTARRSRDLWYGSWMLSELSKVAANKIVGLSSFDELIFPHPTNEKLLELASGFNAPNKIVAVIEKDKKSEVEDFAEEIKDAVYNYLKKDLAEKTLTTIPLTEKNRELANQQIEDLLEFYWVSVPYNDRKYEVVHDQAEAMLIARKNTRDFNQMTGANVPKSSLDGSRESVINESEYPKNNASDKEDKIRDLYEKYHARQGERLSGVDLLKRLGARKDEPDFKSTSHMAAIPFIKKLDGSKNKLIQEIRDTFAVANWEVGVKDEGSLLFENRILDLIPSDKKRKELIKSLNEIIKKATGNDSKPNPYYALLAADGDNMGKVIDAQENEEAHRTLSKKLSEFATQAPEIVEKDNNGLLVYSGGDDVLAYLPLNTALNCAAQLEKVFHDELSNFSTKDGTTPTLSVGIVIAHHLDPLSDVLELARSGEKKAKQIEGKNGLAVTLSKRSGVDRTIVGKFGDLHKRLDDMINLIDKKIISGGTAYELQELGHTLPHDFPPKGLELEALRIVKHKQAAGGEKLSEDDKKNYLNIVADWLTKLNLNKEDKKYYSLQSLAYEMIIAKELAEEAQ